LQYRILNPIVKTLIIVRHAKSSWDDAGLSDFNRPLNNRGEHDAPRMAKELKKRHLVVGSVLSSPAVRALTTCHVFADVFGFPKDQVQQISELYHARDRVILNVVRSIADSSGVAMLFGHNPGLTDFVNNLLEEEIDNVPTCGIVGCKLKVERWKEASWRCGKMEFFEWPKKK
jgi:phosphohistidine phosphatase